MIITMRTLTFSFVLALFPLLGVGCDSEPEASPDLELRNGLSGSSAEAKCQDDSDCGPGTVCEPSGLNCDVNTCVPGCHNDYDCNPGEGCTIVECITCPCPGYCESTGPVACKTDEDCGPGTVCEPEGPGCGPNHYCVPGCHDKLDCAPDQTCEEVVCVTCPCPGNCV